MLQKNVIKKTYHSHNKFLSNIFLKPKKNKNFKIILNLKNLNSHIKYNKFKINTLQSILKLITPNYYITTINLKNTYYSIPITQKHHKYLHFI